MSNGRSITVGPEVVLTRGGTTASFDGARLRVGRDRTVWTLPLRALDSAAWTPDGAVRVGIHGDPGRHDHGLGRAVVLRAPNRRSAEAFLARGGHQPRRGRGAASPPW
ncbi:hypothetical protein ACSNOK_08460 [Streptomyces sp. URMC 126]|uniref:hypothetical protein n=1 Tax=Streptomyces sp. URMC 126 TaxID=3423401 RepID=UPI003F199A1B